MPQYQYITVYQTECIVIPEPDTGFHIAFKMLDIDGNEHVDKKEFQKVWHVFDTDCSNISIISFL